MTDAVEKGLRIPPTVIPVTHGTTASEAVMMGRQIGDQTSLFYEFRLDDRIPKEHLLRRAAGVSGLLRSRIEARDRG